MNKQTELNSKATLSYVKLLVDVLAINKKVYHHLKHDFIVIAYINNKIYCG